MEKALNWLGENFSVSRNPNYPGGMWQLYYLYGLERAGRLTARRFIGKADWYREGAKFLVDHQDKLSGFWSGTGMAEESRLVSTSFALLFLSKGRWPVLISKLKHPPDEDWNQHRHDLNNLTRFVESRWKKDLTWQVVDLRLASVEDLLQSPVLFLCGSTSPLPGDPAVRGKSRENCGIIWIGAVFSLPRHIAATAVLTRDSASLCRRYFPSRNIACACWSRSIPSGTPRKSFRPSNCGRFWESNSAAARAWFMRRWIRRRSPAVAFLPVGTCPQRPGQTFKPSVQAQIDAALGLGINVLAYATNRELRGKEENFNVHSSRRPGDQAERGRLYIAKIRHPGGCNTAPGHL